MQPEEPVVRALYDPLAHAEQPVAPAPLYVPDAHTVQPDVPVDTVLNKPAAHKAQEAGDVDSRAAL